MPFFILSLIIQVALVMHIVKTGRDTKWIWIVAMLPLAGSLAYFFIEVLPGMQQSRVGRKAKSKFNQVVAPNKNFDQAGDALSQLDSVENNLNLAKQCLSREMYTEAEQLLTRCLRGPLATDPEILAPLAEAQFGLGYFDQAQKTLDNLIEANPNYKNQVSHLLYARILDALKDDEGAKHQYETLHQYYSGPDADYYYALFLQRIGNQHGAATLLNDCLNYAKTAGHHYNDIHKPVLKKIRAALEQKNQ